MSSCPTCLQAYKPGDGGVCQNCARTARDRKRHGHGRHGPIPGGSELGGVPSLGPLEGRKSPKPSGYKNLTQGELGNNTTANRYSGELEPKRRSRIVYIPAPVSSSRPKRRRNPVRESQYKPRTSPPPKVSVNPPPKSYERNKEDQKRTVERNRLIGVNKFLEALYGQPVKPSQILKKAGFNERQLKQLRNLTLLYDFLRKLTREWSELLKDHLDRKNATAVIRAYSLNGENPSIRSDEWRKLGFTYKNGPQAVLYQVRSLHPKRAEFEKALVNLADRFLQ